VAEADAAAIEAVKKVGRFPHLPPGSNTPVDIQFTLDSYNLFKTRVEAADPTTKVSDKFLLAIQAEIMDKLAKTTIHDQSMTQDAIITITIDKAGHLTDTVLSRSSGCTEYDSACMKGVESAFPLHQPPPKPLHDGSLELKCSIGEAKLELNNQGVQLLKDNQIDASIAKFIEALHIDPDYPTALTNLAIAYNNKGLQLRRTMAAAAQFFCRALFMQPNNTTTQANLTLCMQTLGKKCLTFEDHIKLAEECIHANDVIGACVEYQLALAKKEDPEVAKLVAGLKDSAKQELLKPPNP
jgi:tetratricopeptide (TPR) repeat protein